MRTLYAVLDTDGANGVSFDEMQLGNIHSSAKGGRESLKMQSFSDPPNLCTRWIVRVQTDSNLCEDSSKGAREGGQERASEKGRNGGRVKFAVAQFWATWPLVVSFDHAT